MVGGDKMEIVGMSKTKSLQELQGFSYLYRGLESSYKGKKSCNSCNFIGNATVSTYVSTGERF
jgi:hypothetical protein